MEVLKKSFLLMFSFIGLLFLSSVPAFASSHDGEEPLTFYEISQLKEMGLMEDLIESLTNEELREMIKNNAEILSITSEILTFDETGDIASIEPTNQLIENYNTIVPANLDTSKVKIYGVAYSEGKLSSGKWSGYRRIKFSGGFEWNTAPVWALTDGLAVGWGNSNIIVPTASGQVDSFSGVYYRWGTNKQWNIYKTYSRPSDFVESGGVGFAIDLRGSLVRHKGTIQQTAYSRASIMDTNVRFSYGHRQLSGFGVSFSKGGGYFAVTPTINVKTGYSADTLSW